ncbi:MAG: sulfotransferase [Gammaproteobacteria bacterium]|nr:sulfotransferase [Gammaproteobacteria bacterium]
MLRPKFHFISGLPRSGSTLLSAILRQNPRYHASMTSAVGSLFSSVISQLSAGSEYAPLVTREQKRELLKGLFSSYYHDKQDKEIIFDTNRMWSARLPALLDLYPEAKMLCTVRNVAWVLDSFESKFQQDPFENTSLYQNEQERNTVYSRAEALIGKHRQVGFPWAALRDAYYSKHADSMLLIDYELLTRDPARVIALIYEFLGEDCFEHDFDHVDYDEPQFDDALGIVGLHKVQPKVEFKPRATVLPPDLYDKYSQMSFWLDRSHSKANVIASKG